MAIDFAGSASSYIVGSPPLTGPPLSISLWYKSDTADSGAIIALDTASGTQRMQVQIDRTLNQAARFAVVNNNGSSASTFEGSLVSNTWYHTVAVTASNSQRLVYFNGEPGVENTEVRLATTINNLHIGTRWSISRGYSFDGQVQDVGIWNKVLSQEEVLMLSKGFPPNKVRPQNLVFYAPLITDVNDIVGGGVLTKVGVTLEPNPKRIFR